MSDAISEERKRVLDELKKQRQIYESSCHDEGDRGTIQGIDIAISVVNRQEQP